MRKASPSILTSVKVLKEDYKFIKEKNIKFSELLRLGLLNFKESGYMPAKTTLQNLYKENVKLKERIEKLCNTINEMWRWMEKNATSMGDALHKHLYGGQNEI